MKIFIKLNELVSSCRKLKIITDTFDSQPNDADYFTITFGTKNCLQSIRVALD